MCIELIRQIWNTISFGFYLIGTISRFSKKYLKWLIEVVFCLSCLSRFGTKQHRMGCNESQPSFLGYLAFDPGIFFINSFTQSFLIICQQSSVNHYLYETDSLLVSTCSSLRAINDYRDIRFMPKMIHSTYVNLGCNWIVVPCRQRLSRMLRLPVYFSVPFAFYETHSIHVRIKCTVIDYVGFVLSDHIFTNIISHIKRVYKCIHMQPRILYIDNRKSEQLRIV